MRIAVIGGGIAGLVTGYSLQRDGHQVTLYEQRAGSEAEGAGLTLFGNAFEALAEVGLSDAVRHISNGAGIPMHPGQRSPEGRSMLTLPASSVASLRSVHRVTLHEVLTSKLAPGTMQLGARALVAKDGRPKILVNETTADYDLVVVADGLRSENRKRLGLDTGVSYAGFTAWRGVTASPPDIGNIVGETWGRGSIFGIIPLINNELYWFGTLTTEANTKFADEQQAVRELFGTWHNPIPACIDATPAENVIRHDVFELARPLNTFTRGQVVLVGDAAHAMAPNLGQGAAQGIEDAVTLALLLHNQQDTSLKDTLAKYSRLRRRRTTALWRKSRWMSKVAQASGPLVGLRDFGMRLVPDWLAGLGPGQLGRWEKPNPVV